MSSVNEIVATWPQNIVETENERNRKYSICKACEFFREQTTSCSVCKCNMDLLTWSKLMGVCPKGKYKIE